MKTNILRILIIGLFILSCSCTDQNVTPTPSPEDEFPVIPGGETVLSIEAVKCTKVARVIGKSAEDLPNPNDTPRRFRMASTDFGNMWDTGNSSLFCVFGDNFNSYGGDWLSNAVAVSTDKDMSDGLFYDSMLWDDRNDKRTEIIHRAEGDVTCIPTGGFSVTVNGHPRQYVNYMSIKEWKVGGDNDSWAVNFSEIVYSDDLGETWTKSGVKWDSESNFAQIAYVVRGDTVYMWGTPSGRHGNVYLARVGSQDVLSKNKYEYWDGQSWSYNESAAAPVANGTVSEMSVRYNTYYNRYIMMYLSVNQRRLVYRDAQNPEGEWSAEKIILDGTYGPSIHPWFCDARDLWFVSSSVTSSSSVSYDTWHIFLYHAKLKADADGFNMVWEGGFEYDTDKPISYKTLWNAPTAITSHDSHSGAVSCKVNNSTAGKWVDGATQKINIHKNSKYLLTGYAKSSNDNVTNAYLGVRLPSGEIIDDNPALNSKEWTKIQVEFNSLNNTSLDVFFGTWGAAGLSVLFDDIKLEPVK